MKLFDFSELDLEWFHHRTPATKHIEGLLFGTGQRSRRKNRHVGREVSVRWMHFGP